MKLALRQKSASRNKPPPPDFILSLSLITLLLLGVTMVTSASVAIAEQDAGNPFYYGIKQMMAVAIGLGAGGLAYLTPMERWRAWSVPCTWIGIALLIIVLIPGVGLTVNGSTRWLPLGFMTFQASEWMKWAFVLSLAHWMDVRAQALKTDRMTFIQPLIFLGGIVALLLAEPDFGAASVISATTMAMLFLGGVPLTRFLALGGMVGLTLVGIAFSAPYRLARLTSFLDPWADQFDSGYQLTQALIAFGRGEWTGMGLGGSIQKLFYLPEAFSDFLFAVLAEELGLVGALVVLGLYLVILVRGFSISLAAIKLQNRFAAYVAFGLSFWLVCQAFVNIGVNAGVLPTKGLTLPLMSAGGSSVLICCIAAGMLLRIHREVQMQQRTPDYTL